MHQDIRPLRVLILNLMPTKIGTETQLLRNLRESPFVHTCIFVTHRPAAAAICSRRYRAADGIVREENACSENI